MRRTLAVALAAACGLAACDRPAAATGTAGERRRRATVVRGDVAERLLLTGELRAAGSVDLTVPRTDAWELSIQWLAADGAAVKAGERVLEFDNSAFTSQLSQKKLLVLQARSDLRSTQEIGALAIADKEAEVREKQTALTKAEVLAAVPAELLPGRTAQERQLELVRARAAVTAARTDADALRRTTALDLRVKQIALDKTTRAIDDTARTMDELVVKAPHDGVLMIASHPWEGRTLHVGDTVQPGWPVVSFPDTSKGLEVTAELSDVEDGKVAVGAVGTCTLDAYPAVPLPCTVRELTPVARSKDRQSLRRAFDVILTLDRQDAVAARPGMSVKVELRRGLVAGAAVVPRGAIVRDAEGARVRVPDGQRPVTLGPCDAQGCVVEQGLAVGDAVMIGGGR